MFFLICGSRHSYRLAELAPTMAAGEGVVAELEKGAG